MQVIKPKMSRIWSIFGAKTCSKILEIFWNPRMESHCIPSCCQKPSDRDDEMWNIFVLTLWASRAMNKYFFVLGRLAIGLFDKFVHSTMYGWNNALRMVYRAIKIYSIHLKCVKNNSLVSSVKATEI